MIGLSSTSANWSVMCFGCILFFLPSLQVVKHSALTGGLLEHFWSLQHQKKMCVSQCSRCVGFTLVPLAIICILANVLLLFPDLQTKYLLEGHVTSEARWSTGIWASGVLVRMLFFFFRREAESKMDVSDVLTSV